MAAISKTTWASFIPALWAQRILAQLRANLIASRLVSVDYADEVKALGDTVKIGKVGALTAADKVGGTALVAADRQAPAATSQDLVLNRHKIVPFVIEDVARGQALPSAMDAQVAEAARALATAFESDILAAIVANAGITVGDVATDANNALLLAIRKGFADNLAAQNAPKFMLWSTKDTNSLLGGAATQVFKANERGDAGEALREGSIGRLYGIEHYESQLVTTVTTDTQNVGFAKGAVQVAVRPLAAPPDGVGAKGTVIADPETGLAIRMVSQYDMNAVGLATNVDILYGIKVVRPEWAVLAHT